MIAPGIPCGREYNSLWRPHRDGSEMRCPNETHRYYMMTGVERMDTERILIEDGEFTCPCGDT